MRMISCSYMMLYDTLKKKRTLVFQAIYDMLHGFEVATIPRSQRVLAKFSMDS